MKLTWYPRNLIVAIVMWLAFAAALTLALDVRRGLAAGVVPLLVCFAIDGLLTFNPARWWRRHH